MPHKALTFLGFSTHLISALERGPAAQKALGAGRGARQSAYAYRAVASSASLLFRNRIGRGQAETPLSRCSNFLDPTLWTNYRRRTKTIEDLSE